MAETLADDSLKYRHLRRAMNQAVEKSLQDFTVNDFLRCFALTTAKDKEVMKKYHSKIVKVLRDKILEEFDTICVERDIEALLGQLEEITNLQPTLASGERCQILPEVSPVDLCRAQVYAKKLAERNALLQELQTNEKEVEALAGEVETLQEAHDQARTDLARILDVSKLASMRKQLAKSIPPDPA
eukprot:Phypoly_transcript_14240.p1 GENE.Phypoly_transcript_14240~~Phypoly_transcript_14240.p1  ORF type:complete len:186 (+),score=40.66 Phypoly_transcript_14240:272-829(+)